MYMLNALPLAAINAIEIAALKTTSKPGQVGLPNTAATTTVIRTIVEIRGFVSSKNALQEESRERVIRLAPAVDFVIVDITN